MSVFTGSVHKTIGRINCFMTTRLKDVGFVIFFFRILWHKEQKQQVLPR